MKFLKNIKWTPLNILKAAGLAMVALIVLNSLANLFSVGPQGLGGSSVTNMMLPGSAPSSDSAYYGDGDYGYDEETAYGENRAKLSISNVSTQPPNPNGGSIGGDAEDFETTEYSASIETRNRDEVCEKVSDLKSFDYVVFENANEYDNGCNYTFKVAHDNVAEVLTVIESLDPKNLSENTRTIKRQLDDFTSEAEILEKKLAVINETLEGAIVAYDEITVLATRTQDVDSLAKIINSKINLIERLSQDKINTTAQLERLSRNKATQLDRLEYTYFNVHVYESKFVDGESIKDSWKSAVKTFVRDINQTAQDVTVNLISLLFVLLQYVLYFFILLFAAKYVWKSAQHIWNK